MSLRDSGELLAAAVAETLDALPPKPEDSAARRLARQYAEAIDYAARAQELAELALAETSPADIGARMYVEDLAAKVEAKELLDKLGPKLLAVLDALEATPAARHRAKGARQPDAPRSQIQALRDARSSTA